MHVHVAFVTKYRRKVFDSPAIDVLRGIDGRVCLDFESTLVEYPPKVSISSLVNSRKGVSSRMLRKQRPDIRRRYWKGTLWSPSYFAASCGGAPISIVRQYIEQQQTPH